MTATLATRAAPALLAAAYVHLDRLSDDTALFEHARYATPRREHGYCLDDVARGLLVLCRDDSPSGLDGAPDGGSDVVIRDRLIERYLAFVTHAQSPGGRSHNRLAFDRRWRDEPGLGDWWGRGLWGLGTAAARSAQPSIRANARHAFETGASRRSPDRKSVV